MTQGFVRIKIKKENEILKQVIPALKMIQIRENSTKFSLNLASILLPTADILQTAEPLNKKDMGK